MTPAATAPREVFVISDATGETAEKVVRAALLQFTGAPVHVQLADEPGLLRLAGERQTLTGDEGEAAPGLGRTADPMLSIIQLVRSRAVAGAVVDSLGLQLASRTPEFRTEDLARIQVDPRAAGDSVMLTFAATAVTARRADRSVTVPYGQVVNLGIVQFVVPTRPGVESAVLGIQPREMVIDWLTASLLTNRREETDVTGLFAEGSVNDTRVPRSGSPTAHTRPP